MDHGRAQRRIDLENAIERGQEIVQRESQNRLRVVSHVAQHVPAFGIVGVSLDVALHRIVGSHAPGLEQIVRVD